MPGDPAVVVSPADARALVGSFRDTSSLFLKGKFFEYGELFGLDKRSWLAAFEGGDFALFRLTPEKYHYNHVPVSGRVVEVYEVPGGYHSCNPGAVVAVATPYSKNKRVVTVIDTDVDGGTGAGLVAMVEVVALMVGEVVQAYSRRRYDGPCDVRPGLFLEKGAPKSLFRPGSSTVVLVFQPGRVEFAADLVQNLRVPGVRSRFSHGFGAPLVETDVKVRSGVATAARQTGRTGRASALARPSATSEAQS
jgi:phosphatidylserine decarboxylase